MELKICRSAVKCRPEQSHNLIVKTTQNHKGNQRAIIAKWSEWFGFRYGPNCLRFEKICALVNAVEVLKMCASLCSSESSSNRFVTFMYDMIGNNILAVAEPERIDPLWSRPSLHDQTWPTAHVNPTKSHELWTKDPRMVS